MEHLPTRRAVLRAMGGAGALVVLGACSGNGMGNGMRGGQTNGTSTGGTPGTGAPQARAAVPALERTVRDLELRLRAAPATATIVAGRKTPVLSFTAEVLEGDPASVVPSGSHLGPTLRFRTGQRVRIRFENELDDHSIVHWHGLTVPQGQDGQPHEAVDRKKTYDYDFVVENAPGTYWYHPHPHGHTGEQVYRGLAGLLVIEGDEPLPSGDNDLGLVLQDRTIADDGTLRYSNQMHDRMMGFVGNTLVTNGVADYTAGVRREPYRLRILNGSNARTQLLRWSTGAPFHVVATDGHLVPETVRVDQIVLTPAQRVDVWMDFSTFAAGARPQLLSADLAIETGGMGGGMGGGSAPSTLTLDLRVAATFVTDGDARPGTAPTTLGPRPTVSAASAINANAPKQVVLATQGMMNHTLNGRTWEDRSVTALETVTAGTTEVWELVNTSPMPHPIHLHGNPFRVVHRSWDNPALEAAWKTIENGLVETGWRDTVLVWPGQRVRIVVPFAKHEGFFLYHCHILEHEDAGMMRSYRVLPA